MKLLCIALLGCLLLCLSNSNALPADGEYTTKYDNVDVDKILKNERLLRNYMNCIMDRGKCTKEGLEVKSRIPETMATNCAKCSDAQKKMVGKILAFLLQNRKDYWNELLEKYDPDGTFRQRYELEDW